MMMMSTKYAVGTWVGYHNRQKVMSGFMETMTLPIVNGWMQAMHKDLPPVERVKPSGLQTLPAYVVRTHVGVGSREPSPSTDLFPSWYKQPNKNDKDQKIDQVSDKLATECTPARAIKDGTNANSNTFSVDKFVDGGAAGGNTSEKDDVHKCDDVKPTITLNNNDFNCPGSCVISANVTAGTHPLTSDKFAGTVNFLIDGQVVNTQNISSAGTVSFNYSPDSSGSKSLSVEVIDSVLYDGTDSTTITTSGGSGSLQALSPDGGNKNRGGLKFTWSNAGAASYEVSWTCTKLAFTTSDSHTTTGLEYTPGNSLYTYNNGAAYPASCTWTVKPTGGSNAPSKSFTLVGT
jgi:hypothetical protein